MKAFIYIKIFLSLSFLLFNSFAEESSKIPIAIMEFNIISGDATVSDLIYKTFYNEMKKSSQFEIIGKEEIGFLLKLKNFENPKCKTDECLTKICEYSKVDKIIIGNVTKVLNKFVIEIRVFDALAKKMVSTDFIRVGSEKELNDAISTSALTLSSKLTQSKKGEVLEQSTLKKYYEKVGEKKEDKEYKLMFGIGGSGGYNLLLNGYSSYGNNNITGAGNIKIRLLDDKGITNLMFGGAVEFFPLVTPEGTYGTSEDVFTVNLFFDYGFLPGEFINPYLGGGIGGYFDTVKFETPMSGTLSNTYFSFGLNARAGAEISIISNLCLVPEVKAHFIMGPKFFFAINVSFGGGAVFYF
ncbi:MAG: hypothetical protein ABH873_07795 [Candidatus Firestonebacteria bacterium]